LFFPIKKNSKKQSRLERFYIRQTTKVLFNPNKVYTFVLGKNFFGVGRKLKKTKNYWIKMRILMGQEKSGYIQ